jgi:hypothetical protein
VAGRGAPENRRASLVGLAFSLAGQAKAHSPEADAGGRTPGPEGV